jgi:hypothetical protein
MYSSSQSRQPSHVLAALAASVSLACGAGGDGDLTKPGGGQGAGTAGGSTGQGGAWVGGGANGGSGFYDETGGSGPTGTGGTSSISGPSTPSNIDECGQVDAATLQALQAGSGSGGGMRWLYPYDGTVWPRGLLAPVLQWEGGGADRVYVRMTSREFTYQGCFGPLNAPYQLPIPQQAWQGAGEWSNGYDDPLQVELTTMSGGSVSGTIRETWRFALATIKGAIYYNTYTSPLAGTGAVLKVLPDQAHPTLLLTVPGGNPTTGPCISCHSLSANGAVMTANRHDYNPLIQGPDKYLSASYSVASSGAALTFDRLPEAGFSGIYIDGTIAVTNGPPSDSTVYSAFFPAGEYNIPALLGPEESRVLDLTTGQVVNAPGWTGVVRHAQMPMFSPDGKHIVYNDFDEGGGRSLHVADFDRATVTFSNHREIFRDTTRFAGWPFFTPDGSAVVFALGSRKDFASQLPNPLGIGPLQEVGFSQLHIVYLSQPGVAVKLNQANGITPSGSTYLPHNDIDREFFPTMSPVAAGGYYWLFFTSRRQFGNTLNLPVESPESKKIWVSAISAGSSPGQDPSQPAFILPGQELHTGNIRAFAALEPCKEDGQSCQSGTECCKGFCINGICQPPQECANLDDRCETSADCCNERHRCIGGYCAEPIPR